MGGQEGAKRFMMPPIPSWPLSRLSAALPPMGAKRLQARPLAAAPPPGKLFLDMVGAIVKANADWVPPAGHPGPLTANAGDTHQTGLSVPSSCPPLVGSDMFWAL